MSDNTVVAPVSPGRMVTTAFFHAALLMLFTVFFVRMVPDFAEQAEHAGGTLPVLARWMIVLSAFLMRHWYWALPLLAVADAAGLFAAAKTFGKRGLLVWSVVVSGIVAGIMILGTMAMLDTISSMA
ncbi:MAG TPA: hypothetical protein PLJ71_16250 [Candidatus Hydrogenedentes bacterium]|nr:hypothetical protein [Candidatus Hydrogenedentota bacterium]